MALTIKVKDSLYVYQGNGWWFDVNSTTDPKWPVSVSSDQLLSVIPSSDQYTRELVSSANQNDVGEIGQLTAFRLFWWKLKAKFGISDNSDLGRILHVLFWLVIIFLGWKILSYFGFFKRNKRRYNDAR